MNKLINGTTSRYNNEIFIHSGDPLADRFNSGGVLNAGAWRINQLQYPARGVHIMSWCVTKPQLKVEKNAFATDRGGRKLNP